MGSSQIDFDSFRPSNGSCINRALLEPSSTKGQYVWFSLLEFARGNFFSAAGFHQKRERIEIEKDPLLTLYILA